MYFILIFDNLEKKMRYVCVFTTRISFDLFAVTLISDYYVTLASVITFFENPLSFLVSHHTILSLCPFPAFFYISLHNAHASSNYSSFFLLLHPLLFSVLSFRNSPMFPLSSFSPSPGHPETAPLWSLKTVDLHAYYLPIQKNIDKILLKE